MTFVRVSLILLIECLIVTSLAWGAPPKAAAGLRRVIAIRSPSISQAQLENVAGYLGIVIGAPLTVSLIDQRIRALYRKQFESLVVEVEEADAGLIVTLSGVRIRVLRNISARNLDAGLVKDAALRAGFVPGQRFDSRSLNTLVENLRIQLRADGFYLAHLDSKVTDIEKSELSDIEIVVVRNAPTVIGAIRIVGPDESETRELLRRIPLRRGQPLRQEDVEKSTVAIGRYLQENQFPLAKIKDVATQFSTDMKTAEVLIEVRTGRRLQLEFEGNSVFDDMSLRSGITEAMLAENDSDRQMVEAIEKRYRDVGYHFCKVEIKDDAKGDDDRETMVRRVSIREGDKVIIDKIQVVGSGNTELIENLFFEHAPGILKRRIFWEAGLDDAARNLERALRDRGYLKARLSSLKPVFESDRRGVQLFTEVETGVQSRFGTIEIIGNEALTQAEILVLAAIVPSEEYGPTKTAAAQTRISDAYRERGFVDVQCELTEVETIKTDESVVSIQFKVIEGISYRVGEVAIQGNHRTEARTILREMLLSPGDVFVPSKLSQSEENIGLLGIFSKVEVIAHSSLKNPRNKDIKIAVTESRPGIGEVGTGAAYEDPKFRIRSFLGLAYRNLLGRNHTVSFRGEVAFPISRDSFVPFVEYATVVGFRAPNPWELPLVFNAQLGLDRFELSPEGPKLLNRARIEERIERKLSGITTFYYRLHRFERSFTEDLSKTDANQDAADVIGSTGPGVTVDFRDDVFNPTRGSFHTWDLEYANQALLSNHNIHFAMVVGRNSFYVPFIASTQLRFYVGLGYARSLEDSAGVPKVRLLNEMALGGQLSIRGYSLRVIKPPENAYDSAFYNVRSEVGIPIFGDFGAAVFFDSGQIFPNIGFPDRSVPSSRGDGVGFGLRYKTPIGPVVIDFAKGLGTAEPLKFYFTLGTI